MYFQGFHICLELSEEERASSELKNYRSYPKREKQTKRGYGGATEYNHSDEVREQLRAATTARHRANEILNMPRNEAIVADYKAGGVGIVTLAKKYQTSRDTVLRVLHEAQDKGLVKIRKRGQTVRNGA